MFAARLNLTPRLAATRQCCGNSPAEKKQFRDANPNLVKECTKKKGILGALNLLTFLAQPADIEDLSRGIAK
jgi:hypothetical protein